MAVQHRVVFICRILYLHYHFGYAYVLLPLFLSVSSCTLWHYRLYRVRMTVLFAFIVHCGSIAGLILN